MQVVLAESALEDLQAILEWYRQENVPEVGQRLVEDILNQSEQIAVYPQSGRMVPEFQNPKLRELIRPPFRIVYLLDDDVCSIVRVWRSERLLCLPEDIDEK